MELINKMMKFINESPCNYWAVENASALLADNGYRELSERDPWELQDGGKYYVKRNSSSLIAFRYRKNRQGFLLVATHSDSPCFKVKENPNDSNTFRTFANGNIVPPIKLYPKWGDLVLRAIVRIPSDRGKE